eukprot:1156042-Pelagomonas_calceolata.AAC.6
MASYQSQTTGSAWAFTMQQPWLRVPATPAVFSKFFSLLALSLHLPLAWVAVKDVSCLLPAQYGPARAVEDVSLLAALLNTDQQGLIEEIELYNEVVLGHEKDPFGKTSFPPGACMLICLGAHLKLHANPFFAHCKTCCIASAAGSCMLFLHASLVTHTTPADIFFGGSMYAAEVTPVVHYTMGGIEIDSTGRALAAAPGAGALGGLYAAGEASGGQMHVHGAITLLEREDARDAVIEDASNAPSTPPSPAARHKQMGKCSCHGIFAVDRHTTTSSQHVGPPHNKFEKCHLVRIESVQSLHGTRSQKNRNCSFKMKNMSRKVAYHCHCTVHGVNRLGGNSLLECAVFGSITGKAAVTYAVNLMSN